MIRDPFWPGFVAMMVIGALPYLPVAGFMLGAYLDPLVCMTDPAEAEDDPFEMEWDDGPCSYCREREREYDDLCEGCDLHLVPPKGE